MRTDSSDNPDDYNFDRPGLEAGDILGLMRFGEFSQFCLAHLFTDRQFPNGLLGLANIASPSPDQTGGICSEGVCWEGCHSTHPELSLLAEFRDFSFSPPRPIIFNTGLSTYNNAGQRMILSEMMRVTGHELGHNWGSHHDPNSMDCTGFIMNEFAQDGSRDTHMVCCRGNSASVISVCLCVQMFSDCSRRSVGNVLLNKAGCFIDRLCGDYLVDEGEDCDAGTEGDSCCTSQCKFTEGALCR